jgi:oxygen-dependent protoporphyrinogen oxidase
VRRRVAVVGAGIAGLCTAHELLEREPPEALDLVCLDADTRPGGLLRTGSARGFLFEWAANGFLDDAPATLGLVRRLGLTPRLVRSRSDAERRFVYVRGKLRELPSTPAGFVGSGILSLAGRARVMAEPMVPKRPPEAGDETIHAFATRRLGAEAARTLVDCVVSGIWAGDAERLSLRATFPKLHELEARHGSLFRAMKSGGDGGLVGARGQLVSLAGGMQELTDALAARLGPRLVLGRPLARLSDLGRRGFRLHFERGAPEEAEAVVLACPARAAASIVAEMDPELAVRFGAIETAPIAVLHFGYRRDALPERPDGFGFLAPRSEGLRILGTLWASDIFDGRAPAGSQLLTTLVGGAHDPHVLDVDDAALVRAVRDDLARVMRILPDPYFVQIVRHPAGIPQYNVGHLERLAGIEERLARFPGLSVTGASYRGVSINGCIEDARSVAGRVADFLAGQTSAAATAGPGSDDGAS